jgi:hypothetical protein
LPGAEKEIDDGDPGHTVAGDAFRTHAVLQSQASSRGVKKSWENNKDFIKISHRVLDAGNRRCSLLQKSHLCLSWLDEVMRCSSADPGKPRIRAGNVGLHPKVDANVRLARGTLRPAPGTSAFLDARPTARFSTALDAVAHPSANSNQVDWC